MPCSDGGPSLEQRFDSLAALLCEAMSILEETGGMAKISPALLHWWSTHKEGELGRVRSEAAAKLSARERIALGIDEKGRSTR